MAGLVGLWNRLRNRTRHKARRRVRPSGLSCERYGIDLLEKRQMLAVTPASDFTYTTTNDQVAITRYIGAATAVEIPATINSLPVISIGNNAFLYCTSLTSVTLPSSVTTIGEAAFAQCSSLASVLIPSGVTSIGYDAFARCTSLKDITIPSSVTTLGGHAFVQCNSLLSVTIMEGVTSIGKAAFAYCSSLTSVTIPSSVPSIEESAFYSCTSLASVTISAGVTSIGKDSFAYCDSLVSLFLPSTVQYLGEYAVDGLSLRSIYFYGDAPQVEPTASFSWDGVTVYHLPGASGWTTQYHDATAAVFPGSMAPTAVVGIRGNGQVQLSWTAPVTNGGLAVTDYTIQYSSDSGATWHTFPHAASVATTTTVTGLTNGTNYLFRVASVNDVGAGLYSANSSVVIPATSPDAPSALLGVRGNRQVQLSWTAPVSNGGLPVKDYLIQYSSDSGSSWQTVSHAASVATTATVTDLKNGTNYLFRVASVNDVGTGLFASTVSKIVPGLVAPPPSGLVASRGNGVVRLSWKAPTSTAGIRVADYAVQYSTNGGASWATVRDGVSTRTSAVLSGLTIGRDHIFRVASVGRAGTGDFSSPSGVVRPATVPQAPVRLMATAGLGQAIVSWASPVSDGGSPITQYLVQYAPRGGRWVTATSVGGSTTSVTVSGLASNRQYGFRVFAVNDLGMGVSSRSVLIKTPPAFAALARL